MNIPGNLRYSKTHEWARREPDGMVTVGITDHAQERLGDIVFVEPPEPGKRFAAGSECAVVESVKAAADIYAPVSGELVAVNALLAQTPEAINRDPYGAWIFTLKPDDPSEFEALMGPADYAACVAAEK